MKLLQAFPLAIVALIRIHSVGAQVVPAYATQATTWSVQDQKVYSDDLITTTIRYGLACLYYATNNVGNEFAVASGPWNNRTGWLTNTDHCTWFGITCNDVQQVEELNLGDNNLGGYFPPEIGLFAPSVKRLDLRGNPIASVGGQLSWIEAFKNLQYLDLYFANFDYFGIPPYFQALQNLEHLDLSYCFFYGDLGLRPFANMAKLTYLDIGGNDFGNSPFPAYLASLPKLERLFIDFAGIGGNLNFVSRFNKQNMFEFWADDNEFEGGIPSEFGQISSLASISLSGCSLTGTIPSELGNLQLMQQMWFYNNSLTGEIPSSIGKLNLLKTFQTELNMLDGSMPQPVCNLRKLALKQLSTDCVGGANAEVICASTCCNCCQAPCFETVAPPVFGFCFSGDTVVEVAGKGSVRMDRLKIGDQVRVENGKFSEVYSFGHFNKDQATEYLQFFGSHHERPLEITKNHMVFVEELGAVPAGSVKVGDKLLLTDGTTAVTKISTVTRTGAYAPFTFSGTIAVNNVVASSYVSLQVDSSYLTVGGFKVVNMQWAAHASQAPHRILCRMNSNFCANEKYTEVGIAYWVYHPFLAFQWMLEQNTVVLAILTVPVLLAFGFFSFAEAVLMNATLLALLVVVTSALWRRSRGSKSDA